MQSSVKIVVNVSAEVNDNLLQEERQLFLLTNLSSLKISC
jgi:hypothetical protein